MPQQWVCTTDVSHMMWIASKSIRGDFWPNKTSLICLPMMHIVADVIPQAPGNHLWSFLLGAWWGSIWSGFPLAESHSARQRTYTGGSCSHESNLNCIYKPKHRNRHTYENQMHYAELTHYGPNVGAHWISGKPAVCSEPFTSTHTYLTLTVWSGENNLLDPQALLEV